MKRIFECTEDGASKFWEVSVDGGALTVRFGKRGTDGQSKTKDLGSPAAAEKEASKLIAEKTRKGYVEIGGTPGASSEAPRPAAAVVPVTAPGATLPEPAALQKTVESPSSPKRAPLSGPQFGQLYVNDGYRPVTWSAAREDLRRRVDPEHQNVIAALVRGWRVQVASREEAESVFARVLALPSEAPKEPAAILAWPGWEFEGPRPRWIVFGAILAARSSDTGPESQLIMAQGPGGAPIAVVQARIAWADEWVPAVFQGAIPAAVGAPRTYLAVGGAMGDGYLALGAAGGKIPGLPFARRTADSNGKKHKQGLAGVELAHVSWDEDACVAVDLSDAGLSAALATVRAVLPEPHVVLGASYDSRS